MTILIKNTLINLDLVESIHFDDDNARISIVFNSTNTRRFDFFDPNEALEFDWKEYDKAVEQIATRFGKFYTVMPRKNPFKLKPITDADLADNSNYKENNNGKSI